MKFNLWLKAICLLIPQFLISQTVWQENFENYQIGSGCLGSSNGFYYQGDYPALVSKWHLQIDTTVFNSENTHFKVSQVNSNRFLEARRVQSEVQLITEYINISNFVDVSLDVNISEVGAHDPGDYIKAYYQLNDNSELLFEVNGAVYDDFSSLTMSQYGLLGDSLRIIIKILNSASDEKIRIEEINVNGVRGQASLLINEIFSYPQDPGASYVELKNLSNQTIDLSKTKYYLSKQQNGGLWVNYQLQGVIPEKGIYVVASDSISFQSLYDFKADFIASEFIDDGNDALCVYSGAENHTGALVDLYGFIDVDGVGQSWGYYNVRLQRLEALSMASKAFNATEWTSEVSTLSTASPGCLENEIRYSSSEWRPNNTAPNASSSSKFITIQDGQVEVNGLINCKKMSVLTDASLVFNSSVGLSVQDTLINEGRVILNSDSSFYSSISVGMYSEGSVEYNLNLSDSWHLVSSPVVGQSIYDFALNPSNNLAFSENNNYGIGLYDENMQQWRYFHDLGGVSPNIPLSTSGEFSSSLGYAILRLSEGLVLFEGTLDISNREKTLTPSKWNLIGNPFACYMSINSNANEENNLISNGNVATDDLYEAIYIWDADNGLYKVINHSSPSSYLSPGQGFFVKADDDGGDYHFTKEMQSHQSENWFERLEDPSPHLLITVESELLRSSTEIKFLEEGSDGFDLGYDAARIPIGSKGLFVASRLVDGTKDSVDFALQCLLVYSDVPTTIPLELWSNEFKQVELCVELFSFPENTLVYLIDQLLGDTLRVIDENNLYETWVDKQTYNSERFILEIQINDHNCSIDEVYNNEVFDMYYASQDHTVLFSHEVSREGIFEVFDMTGRIIYSENISNTGLRIKPPVMDNGVYILRYSDDKVNVIKKVIIR